MLFHFVIFLAMAGFGFGFDNDNFSLSGLTQESSDNVTVISSSDDENYDGLMACACKLAGETSIEGGVQGGVEPGVEPGVELGVSNILISEMANSGLFLPNHMASSLSHSEQSNDVSEIDF